MQNNIPTLYILELDSSVAKSAQNFSYFIAFCFKNLKKNIDRIVMVIWNILENRN